MADPSLVTLTANTWVKVATNVTAGIIQNRLTDNQVYHTYRMTGNTAPIGTAEGILWNTDLDLVIKSDYGIDVYLYSVGVAGKVRVNV